MHSPRERSVVSTRRTLTRVVTLGGLAVLLAVSAGPLTSERRSPATDVRPAALVLSTGDGDGDGDGGLAAKKKQMQIEARQAIEAHPLVQQAIRVLGAELRDVKLPLQEE